MNKRQALWLEWTLACGVGELAGLAGAAVITLAGKAILGSSLHGLILLAGLAVTGAWEGAIVGYFQWTVLRKLFPGLTVQAWVRITAVAMALAWFWGMVPSHALVSLIIRHAHFTLITFVAVLIGLVTGGMVGLIQFFELKNYLPKAGLWIVANALAFTASALVIYWSTFLAFSGLPSADVFALGAVSGLVAGLALGAVSGWFLPRMVVAAA